MMRLFVGVFPPPATQVLAAEAIAAMRRANDGVSWVQRENLHFTLHFVGEVDDDGAARVAAAVREAAAAHAPFGATLGPPGAFPSARKARVIWLGLVEGVEPFALLAGSLERALAARGFEPEAREFTAHLTLGRVREPGGDWTKQLLRAKSLDSEPAARFTVGEVAVVRSTLSSQGAIYEPIEQASLGGRLQSG